MTRRPGKLKVAARMGGLLLPCLLAACSSLSPTESAYKAAIQAAMDRRTQGCQAHPEWPCYAAGAHLTGIFAIEDYENGQIPREIKAQKVMRFHYTIGETKGDGVAYLSLVEGRGWIMNAGGGPEMDAIPIGQMGLSDPYEH